MSREIRSSEVKQHNGSKSVWIVIKNDVYDVTTFLSEHPGGADPLLEAAGMDATRAFEDIGHSADARSLLKKYKIGSLAAGESCGRMPTPRKSMTSSKYHHKCVECGSSTTSHRCLDDEKPWHNFDKPRSTPRHSKTSLQKSRSNSPPPKARSCKTPPPKKNAKSQTKKSHDKPSMSAKSSRASVASSPRIIPRVSSIIVPRRPIRRKPASPPPSSSNRWKWALLALAAAIIVGVAYKKYSS